MLTDEDIDLMAVAPVGLGGNCVKNDELVVVVLIDFRTLPTALDVVQRERMECVFLPDLSDLVRRRIDDVNPNRGVLVGNDLVEVLEARSSDRTIRASLKDELDHGWLFSLSRASCSIAAEG